MTNDELTNLCTEVEQLIQKTKDLKNFNMFSALMTVYNELNSEIIKNLKS